MSRIDHSRAIAHAFVSARNEARALPVYPGERPGTLADAYRIQDEALRLHGGRVAGWKVGRINPPRDGLDRLAGPIFADSVTDAADPVMPVFRGGFAAAEAEFLLRIGTAPEAGRTRFTNEDARAMVDAVHVGIEIASSPYPGINADGPAVTIADFGNNNGLVIGAAVADWATVDLDQWPVALLVNGEEIGRATTATMLDGPFGAVRFLAENLAARGLALEPGQWVSTGAVTGVHEVAPGDRVEALFGERHRVLCRIG